MIGGGDWSEDRLVPDAVRAWQAGKTLRVRRPDAVRPWQHVLEPLSGYLVLAQRLWEQPALAGAYNFGPELGEAVKVRDLVELACAAYGNGAVDYGDGSEGPHKSGWLVLDAGKTESVLGFSQRWTLIEGSSGRWPGIAPLLVVPMHANFVCATFRISYRSLERLNPIACSGAMTG